MYLRQWQKDERTRQWEVIRGVLSAEPKTAREIAHCSQVGFSCTRLALYYAAKTGAIVEGSRRIPQKKGRSYVVSVFSLPQ